MNDEPLTSPPRRGWSCLEWIVAIICLILLGALAIPWLGRTSHMAEQTKASNNCRQIIMALHIWANDEGGIFPDAKLSPVATANEVFRVLIKDDIFVDESVFSSPFSPFRPDNVIGPAPDFPQAVQPGENHWMMISGLKPNSLSANLMPFVFENALTASWPLTWRQDKQKEPVRGRVWKGDKIIIGRLDNSVNVEKLVREKDVLTLPAEFRQMVEKHANGPPRVLDIEEKK